MWFWITDRPVRFLVYAWPAAAALGTCTLFALSDRARIRPAAHVLAGLALVAAASKRIAIPLTALGPGAELKVDLSRPLRGWRGGGVTAAVPEGVAN
jgi:hypothetical protein